MVKPDFKHNYYADLDLPTSASVDDVRKAYRKLALTYHPDRNAGREEECVPRFQAIQAANEVLSDPAIKAKYDQDRRKANFFFNDSKPASSTSSNPYQASSAYPPPPRRTQPGTWQRPTPSYGATPTGADRFSNFPKPANTPPRNGPAADRAQQFRAWQNLNTQTGPAPASDRPRHGPPPPPPPRSPNPPPRPPRVPSRPRPQRKDTKMPTEEQIRAGMRHGTSGTASEAQAAEKQSAWQAFNQGNVGKPGMPRDTARPSVPTTPRKKSGFDPNAPGSDERPAPSSRGHYGHRNHPDGLDRDGYPPPPSGPPPPNASHSPTSPLDGPSAQTTWPPKSTARDGVPYAEANRTSTPYTSFTGEKTSFSRDGFRRSASTKAAARSKHDGATHSPKARSQSPIRRTRQTDGESAQSTDKTFLPGMYSDSSDGATDGSSDSDSASEDDEDDDENGDNDDVKVVDATEGINRATNADPMTPTPGQASATANMHQPSQNRPKKTPRAPSTRMNRSTASFNAASPHPGNGYKACTMSDGDQPSMKQRASSTNIFTLPLHNDMFRSTSGKSRSAEDINTQFSPDGFSGTFQGSPDCFTGTGRSPSLGRRDQSNRSSRATATRGTSTGGTACDMGPPPRRPECAQNVRVHTDVKFSEDEWKKTFQDASWTWPAPSPGVSSKATSKSPSRQNSRLRSQGSHGNDPQTESKERVVDVERDDDEVVQIDTDGKQKPPLFPPRDEGDAMDIDTPPPTSTTALPEQITPVSATESFMQSAPQAAWREKQDKQRLRRSGPREPSVEPNLNTKLDDLSYVEPLATNTGGIHNLADMTSTLPFSSEAATTHPMRSFAPEKLAVPSIPKVPVPPSKLTKASWHAHAKHFATYLQHFHVFNRTMLLHFNARQGHAEAALQKCAQWLEAAGDTSDEIGFGTYSKGVREDERVREAWNIACEKHLDAVAEFGKLRERVRKLAGTGVLLDS